MDMDITQQTEPVRRTFFDVLRDNLRIANKVTFVHRLIYIAEHAFPETRGKGVGDCMQKIILQVNHEYNDEHLSGILLVYPKHFCHLIEGSEDSLYKHLKLLTSVKNFALKFGRMKLLVCYHHCNQRFLPGWVTITGKPSTLLERIDVNSDLYRSSRYVFHCVRKLYKLALLQRPKLSKMHDSFASGAAKSAGTTSTKSGESRSTAPPEKNRTKIGFLQAKYPDCFPEYGLLDFLLSTVYTQDLMAYINSFGVIPPLDAYKDKVWPVPCEFVPFNIFDKPYDPVTDLPTSKLDEGVDMFQDVE